MSVRQNVCSAKRPSAKCLSAKCLSAKCPATLKSDGDIECFIHEKVFPHLMRNFEEKCPLLYSVLQNLLVPDQMHVEEFTKLLNTSQNVELMHWHYFLVFATGNSTMIFGFYLVCCAFDMELENSLLTC